MSTDFSVNCNIKRDVDLVLRDVSVRPRRVMDKLISLKSKRVKISLTSDAMFTCSTTPRLR